MNGRLYVTTHDLSLAGSIRTEARRSGLAVDLIVPGEVPQAPEDTALLVLTDGTRFEETRATTEWAREHGMPIFAVLKSADSDDQIRLGEDPGIEETFAPPTDPSEVVLLARRSISRRHLRKMTGIVGETERIEEVLERIAQIAPVAATVLVTGESGTGKELVARGIHGLSPRRHKPFIPVNVSALAETLLESELFGHEKGAFTGAIDTRRGMFELAHTGTIFLDEIGEMPLATQTKLLRVLEEKAFLRVGGEKMTRVDVRIIAATNSDLRESVALRQFRRDLYHRLNVLRIELPPLRDRQEDIPRLVHAFVEESSRRYERSFHGIAPDAMEILCAYEWPGNVRELKNLIESMVILAPGREIRSEDIPNEVRFPGRGPVFLPAVVPAAGEGRDALRPELEFVFRTLVELRMDMDELRGEFERYRGRYGDQGAPPLRGLPAPTGDDSTPGRVGDEVAARVRILNTEHRTPGLDPVGDGDRTLDPLLDAEEQDEVVVYRSGMTMEDMEREAIRAALQEMNGNRRKAAELLQIGERTLYRKIQRFGL